MNSKSQEFMKGKVSFQTHNGVFPSSSLTLTLEKASSTDNKANLTKQNRIFATTVKEGVLRN